MLAPGVNWIKIKIHILKSSCEVSLYLWNFGISKQFANISYHVTSFAWCTLPRHADYFLGQLFCVFHTSWVHGPTAIWTTQGWPTHRQRARTSHFANSWKQNHCGMKGGSTFYYIYELKFAMTVKFSRQLTLEWEFIIRLRAALLPLSALNYSYELWIKQDNCQWNDKLSL